MRRKLAAGNWKMNGLAAQLHELEVLKDSHVQPECDILICPPATLMFQAANTVGERIAIGGQDCHVAKSGAHTGDISAEMLRDAGAVAVILGHSERRQDHGETDELVCDKACAAWASGLSAVICVGESLAEREAGQTLAVIRSQLAGSVPTGVSAENTVIAYEPIWAIGTGLTPTLEQIAEVHDDIRNTLAVRFGRDTAERIRVLYGGSVKPSNATEIFAVSNVDGALVGGASLKASDFSSIINALEAATN